MSIFGELRQYQPMYPIYSQTFAVDVPDTPPEP
jgi:hypothetical protein